MPITRTYKDKFFPSDKAHLVVEGQATQPPFSVPKDEMQPVKNQKENLFQEIKGFWKKWLTALYR